MITYVIQIDGPEALVKFGRSKNIKSRIASLSTGMPWPLRTVCLFGTDCEAELKSRFKADHVKGEWFRPTPALNEFLVEASKDGRLVRQVNVDQAYINAVLKPRIREYLNGREPLNNDRGDLVRCILADILPSLTGRENELVAATKGHVTHALVKGYGPATEQPHLIVPGAVVASESAAA